MFVRFGTDSSCGTTRPARWAGRVVPLCGLLVLLLGSPAPAQAPSGTYFPTAWRRLAPAPAGVASAAVVVARPAALNPPPAAILRGSAPDDLGMLPPLEDAAPVKQVQLTPPAEGNGPVLSEEESNMPQFPISLQPPGQQRVFALESEEHLQERIRQSDRVNLSEPIQFPSEPVLAKAGERVERRWPPFPEYAEPNYVCYGPLFYQQKNFERYGWDLGAVSPFVSLLTFWFDDAFLPYQMVVATADHTWCGHDCSSGYCLPGDPVPLLLWPPKLPITFEINRGPDAGGCADKPCADKK